MTGVVFLLSLLVSQIAPDAKHRVGIIAVKSDAEKYQKINSLIREQFASEKIRIEVIWREAKGVAFLEQLRRGEIPSVVNGFRLLIFFSGKNTEKLDIFLIKDKKINYFSRNLDGSTLEEKLEIATIIIGSALKVLDMSSKKISAVFQGTSEIKVRVPKRKKKNESPVAIDIINKVSNYNKANPSVYSFTFGFYGQVWKFIGIGGGFSIVNTLKEEGQLVNLKIERHPFSIDVRAFFNYKQFFVIPFTGFNFDLFTVETKTSSPLINTKPSKGNFAFFWTAGLDLGVSVKKNYRLALHLGVEVPLINYYYTAYGQNYNLVYISETLGGYNKIMPSIGFTFSMNFF
ncbi:hypothetical protein KKF34_05935 [Myxococcota bacterium]|nr:hypothetical protein [Myxococcota bacterium]MBU1381760.1 hypothetical protein [Myxococcota bacterium]MBU1496401.1 hypothetical protein [Myxococcota bacterium]